MNILAFGLTLIYGGLCLLGAIVALLQDKIPRQNALLLLAGSLLIWLALAFWLLHHSLIFLLFMLAGCLLISLQTWRNSPYLTQQRHLSHHLIRAAIELALLILLLITFR